MLKLCVELFHPQITLYNKKYIINYHQQKKAQKKYEKVQFFINSVKNNNSKSAKDGHDREVEMSESSDDDDEINEIENE